MRFGLGGNTGLNLGVGYMLQGYNYTERSYWGYYSAENAYCHSLSVSLGIDF